jgi:hypothetical protein
LYFDDRDSTAKKEQSFVCLNISEGENNFSPIDYSLIILCYSLDILSVWIYFIASTVVELRQRWGLTQSELAQKANTKQSVIASKESIY